MEILLAAAAALLFGTGDLLAARAGRLAPSLAVTRTAVASSAVLTVGAAAGQLVNAPARELLIGAGSGFAMIGGLAVLYFGYSASRIGLVAPVSAVTTAAIPVAASIFSGDPVSALTLTGVALGLAALALTSIQGGGTTWDQRAFMIGATAGVLFGVAFSLMGFVADGWGLSAAAAQRVAGLALLTGIWIARRGVFLCPPGRARRLGVTIGVLGGLAVISLQTAFATGATAPVAVAGSQFVTVAVILGVVVEKEPMRWWQGVGVGATALAVGLLAIG